MRVALAMVSMVLAGCSGSDFLRASHQWPDGDVRGELLEIVREELAAADVGLQMRIYPGQSLFSATEQWTAMTRGRCLAARSKARVRRCTNCRVA